MEYRNKSFAKIEGRDFRLFEIRSATTSLVENNDSNQGIYILLAVLTKEHILIKLTELKPVLSAEYSVSEIGLFGSFCDGSFSEDSDIDLLVEFEKPVGWKYFSLEIFLEGIFGRKIELVTKNALKRQIKDRILKQVNYI